MSSSDVDAYLAALDPDRRATLSAVRDVIAAAVPEGYEESVAHGMPAWSVPLSRLPDTYNGEPLMYAALAAQKRYSSVHLMGLYADPDRLADFERRWTASGRRLDMGKSCLRFRTLEQLDLPLLAETLAAVSVDEHVATYQRSRRRPSTAAVAHSTGTATSTAPVRTS